MKYPFVDDNYIKKNGVHREIRVETFLTGIPVRINDFLSKFFRGPAEDEAKGCSACSCPRYHFFFFVLFENIVRTPFVIIAVFF